MVLARVIQKLSSKLGEDTNGVTAWPRRLIDTRHPRAYVTVGDINTNNGRKMEEQHSGCGWPPTSVERSISIDSVRRLLARCTFANAMSRLGKTRLSYSKQPSPTRRRKAAIS